MLATVGQFIAPREREVVCIRTHVAIDDDDDDININCLKQALCTHHPISPFCVGHIEYAIQ
jgi:hypothetical protein